MFREVEVALPFLHADQVRALSMPGRYRALRCGRRWGKTQFACTVAADYLAKGRRVGWFAPDYKIEAEAFNDMLDYTTAIRTSASKIDKVIRCSTGGRVEFWSLENERAGRSRKYHLVIIDEAAFAKNNTMMGIWEKAIKPTLLDYRGQALVCSNTNGIDTENFFWRICNQPEYGFQVFHAPTHGNPFLPRDEVVKLKEQNHPLVYQQEYLAEFVDWSGVAFFSLENMLVNGEPLPGVTSCDSVFATIDTATKTGNENDGTAVIYWARNRLGVPLVIIDYDIMQMEGSLLETWLPSVFKNLEHYAKQCGARMGSLGAWIEDASSGMILLQQAARRNMPAHAIESDLTKLGKTERAINVSGYVYRGEVKLTQAAFERTITYKQASRNQLLAQVIGFRVGDKETTEDDLLDCFTYGISLALGSNEGF